MKRFCFVLCLIILSALAGSCFLLPKIEQIHNLPNEMLVTYDDITSANEENLFSPVINLSLPKNLVVASNEEVTTTTLNVKLFNLFTIKKINIKLLNNSSVYVGGETVGFNLFSEGVICVGSNPIVTADGVVEPIKESKIEEGDAITHIEGIEIKSIEDVDRIINLPNYAGKELQVTLKHNGEEISVSILPKFDLFSQKYKLGMWVRNNASGVGTLTYVKQNNFRFGAVGHPIVDASLGENFNVETGNIYRCKLLGIKKGEKNNPGEIRSSINLSDDSLGLADTNCKYGVYGNILNKSIINAERTANLGGRLSVKLGDAKIYCNLDDEGVKAYDIKIIKANKQSTADDKSMIIKVTDKELLEKTGGIIQGMSGSPIVQNGKLVGAVTHVFVNDPTRGYGVYVDWMVDN
ncbi:MAG: SpoIVB peptidase [Clostridia bacterium]|nr:SpoIVB peptidase [Clostridia bacterium]